jgi:tryptophanyl-tRNA synthetase
MGDKKRVLSGIQPSGLLHLGNYFGAMQQYLEMQNEGNECYFFIANYHAMTTVQDPAMLRGNTLDVALKYLAIGLDPEKAILFRQSDIPEVCELTWILSTITPMGLLERCHSFKDKTARGIAASHALFSYPVLMAADILMYKSDIVPVGKDQKQHVEVTRDIAIKFNNTFGEILTVPDIRLQEMTQVVPGIDGQKMSKSYDNIINPFDSEKALKKQVMSIVTDSTPLEEPKDPDTCNVFALYKLFAEESEVATMRNNYVSGGYGYGHAKKELLARIMEHFGEARKRYEELQGDIEYVEKILKDGAEKARDTASGTMKEVLTATGL